MQTSMSNQHTTQPCWGEKGFFTYHFVRSNYITAVWNWFLGLAGKAAEPFLFASVLYSSAELIPGVPKPPVGVDLFMFLGQNAALDIGGMGLTKLAQQAEQDGNKEGADKARKVGYALVGLLIANVVLATLGKFLVIPGQVTTAIEGVLLIARAIMAVLYGHVIHSLKHTETEETPMVKVVDVHTRLDELNSTVNSLQHALATLPSEQLIPLLLPHLTTLKDTVIAEVKATLAQVPDTATQPDNVQEDTAIGQDTIQADRFSKTVNRTKRQASNGTNKPDTAQRIAAYMSAYPNATQQHIADALQVSERTVRRYQTGQKSTGPLPTIDNGFVIEQEG